MKKLFSAAALCLFILISASAHALKTGEPAPDFKVQDTNGKTQSLSAYKGKYVVLEWTNNECPFVKKHYQSNNMQTLQKDYTAKGVIWLSVVSSAPGKQGNITPAQANALTKDRKAMPTAVILDADGKLGKLYDARNTPHLFIVGPKGDLIYQGAIDDKPSTDTKDVAGAKNYVRATLDESMSGKPVSNPTTQPYGCGVKY